MGSLREQRLEGEAAVMGFLRERAEAERQTYDQLKNRRASTAMARDGVFLEELRSLLSGIYGKLKIPATGYALKKQLTKKPKKRIANLAISDTHFHSLLDPREVPLAYGPTEEARRFGKIVTDVCEFKPQYRNDTELYVHVFGDIIEGDLHDPREAATQTMQFGAATYYLIQAARAFSNCFPRVVFRCVPGNHGRNKRRHHDRAVSQKWDSFENMIYLAFKYAVAGLPNVEVEIPYTPYYTYKAFDKTGFVTHGDTILDVGFPSDTINIKKIRNQVNEWNARDEHHDLFIVGHVHCGCVVPLPAGPFFMANSCLVPTSSYAISRGHPHLNCGQWVWESVAGHIVGDARFLQVNETHDKDRAYEAVIQPFLGFETPPPLRKR
jgi:hypothetical protein